jgi:hypothetical protein
VLGSGRGQAATNTSDVVLELGSMGATGKDVSLTDVLMSPCAGVTVKTSPLGTG